MAFARVDDGQARLAKAFDQPARRRHYGGEAGDVVAEAGAEAARLDEVPLHVDDDERGARRVEREGEGRGRDVGHQACPAMCRPISATSAAAAGVS